MNLCELKSILLDTRLASVKAIPSWSNDFLMAAPAFTKEGTTRAVSLEDNSQLMQRKLYDPHFRIADISEEFFFS